MSQLKYILFFTTFWDKAPNIKMGSTIFETCPITNCLITNNTEQLSSISQYDAMIFHMADIERLKSWELPNQQYRSPYQRYILFFLESPQNWRVNFDQYNEFFNWTMTYRRDSDIPIPYGWIVPKSSNKYYAPRVDDVGHWNHNFNYSKFAASFNSRPEAFRALARRPKGIAWIVSHCNTESDRERYVNELKNYIQVDIFGACGNELCSKETCPSYVEQNYMFLLAFENSLCDQYVSEKLWTWLPKDIVVVVMGQDDYSAITPPHSIINTANFSEPKHLAAYLKRLMHNEIEYLSHFWWKDYYEARNSEVRNLSEGSVVLPYCRLCEMLNSGGPAKAWDNLNNWWSSGHCRAKGSHPWSKYRSVIEEILIGDIVIFACISMMALVIVSMRNKFKRRLSLRGHQFTGILFGFCLFFTYIFVFHVILGRVLLSIAYDPYLIYTKFHFLWK